MTSGTIPLEPQFPVTWPTFFDEVDAVILQAKALEYTGVNSTAWHSQMFVPFFIIITITGGLYVDQTFEWGQIFASVWAWGLYLTLLATGSRQTKIAVGICLVYATLGEIVMSDLWGLYNYREGHIPLFVPPGHALLYLLGVAVADRIPRQAIYIVPALLAPYVMYVGWTRIDTEALIWFTVFIAFLRWGPNKKLYVTMFVLALVMEIYGTSLGNWAWVPQVPHTPLTSTNPPVTAGVFYCVLDLLVIASTRLALRKDVELSQAGIEKATA